MHLGNYLSLRSYSLPFLKPFLAAKHREAKKNEDRRSKMQLHNPEVAEPNVASQQNPKKPIVASISQACFETQDLAGKHSTNNKFSSNVGSSSTPLPSVSESGYLLPKAFQIEQEQRKVELEIDNYFTDCAEKSKAFKRMVRIKILKNNPIKILIAKNSLRKNKALETSRELQQRKIAKGQINWNQELNLEIKAARRRSLNQYLARDSATNNDCDKITLSKLQRWKKNPRPGEERVKEIGVRRHPARKLALNMDIVNEPKAEIDKHSLEQQLLNNRLWGYQMTNEDESVPRFNNESLLKKYAYFQ